ncbi:MAG: DUF2442 domain-containing protein [Acutalibacteraceae bacterium]
MANTVEYYLSKGFDKQMAEYYSKGRKKIVDVKPNPDFTLLLAFDNNEKRIYDVKPLLEKGGVFTALSDYDCFSRVYLDDCSCVAWDIDPDIDSNVVWNNKIDLCPDSCYVDSKPYVE